ncbi:MAG: hypothetical protein LUH53_02040 [Lachnospiraceae bacterium]|nr:hypothetical protein [Lachnospiraceae bacterium]
MLKRKKKVGKELLSFMLLLFLCMAMPLRPQAASLKNYTNYINKTLAKTYGVASTGTSTRTFSASSNLSWCKTSGVLSVYAADFNNDGTKECVALYITSDSQNGTAGNYLRMATYVTKNGKIKKKQDIALCSFGAKWSVSDIRVYVKTYNKKKYIVIQDFYAVDGRGCTTYILGMTSSGTMQLKLGLYDLYADGLTLSRISSSVNNLCKELKYKKTTTLYSSATGSLRNAKYSSALKKQLKKYGLTLNYKKTYYSNYKDWLIKQTSSNKLLCSIKAKGGFSGTNYYKFTVSISDKTGY